MMLVKKHAILSPSSSDRWLACPASVALSKGIPNESSAYAEEGTLAHSFAEEVTKLVKDGAYNIDTLRLMVEDEEMRNSVAIWADALNEIVKDKHPDVFEAECGLPLESVTGEKDSFGTADALIVVDGVLHIVDFKYGRGVKVSVEQNSQLAIYALAAYEAFDLFCEINSVELHIVQPRLNHIPSWAVSLEELKEFGEAVAERAEQAMALHFDPTLVSDEDFDPDCSVCQFCLAKSKCPKLTEKTRQSVIDALPMLSDENKSDLSNVLVVPNDPVSLVKAYGALDAIELWVKTVREAMLHRLKNGEDIQGYKLVSGRPGNRKWKDEKEVEALMKKMRVREPEMYERKLISPTKAEKLAKTEAIGPRQWKQLEEYIERPEGKPAVALADDPRPAICLADDFDLLGAE